MAHSTTVTDSFARGLRCFRAGDLNGALAAWHNGAHQPEAYGLLCRAMTHVANAERALHEAQPDYAVDVLGYAIAHVAKIQERDIQIDRDALYDSLVAAWEQLKGKHTNVRLAKQLVLKPRPAKPRDTADVPCPHCFEWSPVAAEMDEHSGDILHQDCPVCCGPWEVRVVGDGPHRSYVVRNPEAS